MPSPPSRSSDPGAGPIAVKPRPPFGFEPALHTGTAASPAHGLISWLWSGFAFWTFVPLIGLFGFVYLYLFADDLYECESVVTLQNTSSMSSALGSLSGMLAGSTSSTSQTSAMIAYISSHEMLTTLDKKFHLRQVYSAPGRNPFARLADDASDEDFLTFYQGMVSVTRDPTTGLITVDVRDYDANRATAMQKVILAQASKFINDMSATMRAVTAKYARDQFAKATKAVATAHPYQRAVAEAELAAAQQGVVSASGIANQQQVFLVPVSNPVAPTDTTYPDRLEDEAAVLLAASAFYMLSHLLLSNVRDHRRV